MQSIKLKPIGYSWLYCSSFDAHYSRYYFKFDMSDFPDGIEVPPVTGLFQKLPNDDPRGSLFGPLMFIQNQESQMLYGTAFLIAPGYAITALHVLDEHGVFEQKKDQEIGDFVQGFRHHSRLVIVMRHPLDVLRISYTRPGDIAILKVAKPSDVEWSAYGAIPSIRLSLPRLGTQIQALGCPNSSSTSTQGSKVRRIDSHPRISIGKVQELHAPFRDTRALNFPCFRTSATFSGGMSGGPVFDDEGNICGVICSSFEPYPDDSYASALWPILRMPLPDNAKDTNPIQRIDQLIQAGRIDAIDYDRFQLIHELDGSVRVWRSPDQNVIASGIGPEERLGQEEREILDKKLDRLKTIDPINYAFDDFYLLGYDAYLNQKYDASIDYYTRALENAGLPISRLQVSLRIAQSYKKLNRLDDALDILRSEIEQYSDSEEIKLWLSIAKYTYAQILYTAHRYDEALVRYEHILQANAHHTDYVSRAAYAEASVSKGITLTKLNRFNDAITCHQEFIHKESSTHIHGIKVMLAKAFNAIGNNYIYLGKYNEAVLACDRSINLYKDVIVTDMRKAIANAYVGKGLVQHKLGQDECAIKSLDIVIKEYADILTNDERATLAWAYVNKGSSLSSLNKKEEALSNYNSALTNLDSAREDQFSEVTTSAQFNKILLLAEADRYLEVITECDKIINDPSYNQFLESNALPEALMYKAVSLYRLGDSKQAEQIYSLIENDYGRTTDVKIQNVVLQALAYKAMQNNKFADDEKSLSEFQNIIEKYKDNCDPRIRITVAKIMRTYGRSLERLDRYDAALSNYDSMISLFGGSQDINLSDCVSEALIGRAAILAETEHENDGFEIVERFILDHVSTKSDAILNLLADSYNIKSHLLVRKAKRQLITDSGNAKEGAAQLLIEALTNALNATNIKPDVRIYQLTLGYIYYLLDEIDKSESILSNALSNGGKDLKLGLLKFVSYCETPADLSFKDFLNTIPTD